MKGDNARVFRYFPCDGMCGGYIEIQHEIARQYLCPNGVVKAHPLILCENCQWFIAMHIEYALQPLQLELK